MFASLRQHNTVQRDLIVLVPPHTRSSTIEQFHRDQLIVKSMDITLPEIDECAPK